jgi:hypothetical protein
VFNDFSLSIGGVAKAFLLPVPAGPPQGTELINLADGSRQRGRGWETVMAKENSSKLKVQGSRSGEQGPVIRFANHNIFGTVKILYGFNENIFGNVCVGSMIEFENQVFGSFKTPTD